MSTDKGRSAKPSRSAAGAAGSRERRALPLPTPQSAVTTAPIPKSIGKYSVLSRIGVGAMGVVYKCTQPGLNRPVAIKVLTSSKHALGDVLPRFQREARAASRLNHPSVVQVYDIGTEGELHYIVMEYVEGSSLDKLIGSSALTVDYTLQLMIRIARALQAAHEAGIVHRDIKPSNILIHRSGLPKLVDFGLAKSLHDGPTLSRSGDILGTPRYMSPEQVLMSPKDLDARTDVYSLAAVMYEMLTGKPPVEGPNVMAMLRSLTDEDPVPIRQRNSGVPEAVSSICHKALSKDRDKRYATAGEMAEAMQNVLLERFLGAPQPLGLRGKPGNGDSTSDWPGDRIGERRKGTVLRKVVALPFRMLGLLFRGLHTWRRRGAFAAVLLAGLLTVALATGLPAKWIASYWGSDRPADPAPRVPAGSAAEVLLLQAREYLDGTLRLRSSATPRERYQALIDDLTAAWKKTPANTDLLWLRGRAYRLAGEYLAAGDDLTLFLRQQPTHEGALHERLLATYQMHILYLGNLNEALLRVSSPMQVRGDIELLRSSLNPVRVWSAQLIDALARESYPEAAQLAEAGMPGDVSADRVADLAMLQADTFYRLSTLALLDELATPPDQRPPKQQRRDMLVQRAGQVLRQGLDADPHHVGLLFLLANSFQRRAGWEMNEGEDRDRFLRRHRAQFDETCDRLRMVTLRHGPDTPIARAVLWNNFNRPDMALDQIKDALSCRPNLPHLPTVAAWLTMLNQPDGLLSPDETGRILKDLQPVFATPPEAFNPYFVRALVLAAAGRWWDAREDLQQCRQRLGQDRYPSDVPVHNEWFGRSTAAPTEYLDYTQSLLDTMPVPGDVRIRLGEEVLVMLGDAETVKRDGLDEEMVRTKLGWTHFRLARLFAEKKNRGGVLRHVRMALEQKLPNLVPKLFQDEAVFNDWKNDEEFVNLCKQFEQQ